MTWALTVRMAGGLLLFFAVSVLAVLGERALLPGLRRRR